MTQLLELNLSEQEINAMSSLALAHVGDAVYELMVRSWLCGRGKQTAGKLHAATVKRVCAGAQAEAVKKLLDVLTERELAVYKRGRNCRVNSVPRGANLSDYHAATGFEALFGWLYLSGETDRLREIFYIINEEN